MKAYELALFIPTCRTLLSGPCTSPEHHSSAGPGQRKTGESPQGQREGEMRNEKEPGFVIGERQLLPVWD